jgi:AmmeMemoRadiSam system protein A
MTEADSHKEISPHAKLARAAIEAWVRERKVLPIEDIDQRDLLSQKSAAFVSLKKDGMLRGCIGTFQPTRSNLAEEIVGNAVNAAQRDPRFPPVNEEELDSLDISVDVLSEPEPIPDTSYLDPRRYGVIVQSGERIGLLLPDLEGVDSAEQQVKIACNKAGIMTGVDVKLYRFTVNRYH